MDKQEDPHVVAVVVAFYEAYDIYRGYNYTNDIYFVEAEPLVEVAHR